jgi:hypothetical protein
MKKLLALGIGLAFASLCAAQRVEINGQTIHQFPDKAHVGTRAGSTSNLSYHGGPVIHQAKVVSIFWSAQWGANGSPGSLASSIMSFFGQFGTNPEYNVITQYSDGSGKIQQNNLTNQYWIDSNYPGSTKVTDAMVQAEVQNYFNHGGVIDTSTIYEVFIPNGYYSNDGSGSSCGGRHLQYCAYHSNFTYNGQNIKYASMPYPSCSGCQWTAWSTAQNYDHFACHETREAVTDEDGNAWYDSSGYEADDKCAWTNLFIASGYGYQPEWSNSAGGCVDSQ